MSQKVDAIIIGAGVIGTATAFELAKRGYKTLNIDALPSAGYGPTSNSCAIVRAHYSSFDGVAMAFEGFEHRATRAAHDLMLLHRDQQFVGFGKPLHQVRIQRLDEAHVGDGRIQIFRRFQRRLHHRAKSENGNLFAFSPDFAFADREGPHFLFDFFSGTNPARISDRGGPVHLETGE